MAFRNVEYPGDYEPKSLEQQIAALRKHWPRLDPGVHLVGSERSPVTPIGTLYFAFPKWRAIASEYMEALKQVFALLDSKCKGGFHNARLERCRGEYIRTHECTHASLERLDVEQQGDIIVIPCNFGLRYYKRSMTKARSMFRPDEFGLTTFAAGCMLATHPERLTDPKNIPVDCPGDEWMFIRPGMFDHTPSFAFYGGKVCLFSYASDAEFTDCAAVTGFTLNNS